MKRETQFAIRDANIGAKSNQKKAERLCESTNSQPATQNTPSGFMEYYAVFDQDAILVNEFARKEAGAVQPGQENPTRPFHLPRCISLAFLIRWIIRVRQFLLTQQSVASFILRKILYQRAIRSILVMHIACLVGCVIQVQQRSLERVSPLA